MADLGAVGVAVQKVWRRVVAAHASPPSARATSPSKRTYVVFWDGFSRVSTSTAGALTGVVEESGTPIARAMVRVYHRPSGALIRSVLTESDGSFSLPGLDPTDTQNYFAIAFDPTGGTQYNALIFDRLTAV
jgi:hypothetical protein